MAKCLQCWQMFGRVGDEREGFAEFGIGHSGQLHPIRICKTCFKRFDLQFQSSRAYHIVAASKHFESAVLQQAGMVIGVKRFGAHFWRINEQTIIFVNADFYFR